MQALVLLSSISLVSLLLVYMNHKPTKSAKKFTVYGTSWCGYTKKQRKHLDSKYGKGSHVYVDCDKGGCPPEVTAYPVTELASGKRVTGFNTTL